MKTRTILGLGLIGTAIYAHKQHGGDLSFDSVKKSLTDLWKAMQNKASNMKDKAENFADKAQDHAKDMAKDIANKANRVADDSTGFGPSGYKPGTGTRH